jgi:dephospho-CoA kinase
MPAATPILRIGLTGGIASGKSTVATLFAELGVPVIDTDVIAREVVKPGQPALQRIIEAFGREVLSPDGTLDRERMRARVFRNPDDRRRLESILHPAILQEMERRSEAAGGLYQVLAIPLLVETGLANRVDRVLVIDASESTQIERLRARDGSSEQEARAMLSAQATRAQRLARADDLIVNDGDRTALVAQVERLHDRYTALAGTHQARPR